MSEEDFKAELAALLNKFREHAKGFVVEPVLHDHSKESISKATTSSSRCIRWGRDPSTGELICLERESNGT